MYAMIELYIDSIFLSFRTTQSKRMVVGLALLRQGLVPVCGDAETTRIRMAYYELRRQLNADACSRLPALALPRSIEHHVCI